MRNIERIFCRRHYNSITSGDGETDDTVEKFFAYELDNYVPKWATVFDMAAKTGVLNFPKIASRDRFVQFFYNHIKRGPDFLKPIVQSASDEVFHAGIEAELETKFRRLSDVEKKLLSEEKFREKVKTNSRVHNLGKQAESILNRLVSMRIIVAKPLREAKQFIVASKPVVRFEEYPLQELGEPGVELWTTFSPKLAIGFGRSDADSDCLLLDDSLVRKLNCQLAKQSTAIAARSERLVDSLVKAAWLQP
ncbi:Protein of unknown function [Cribrihabitans marinus]|uniref:DUF4238 domain-containing protein n=2 Tax=Cribrihabitans marinus TaxID=1227549 RepID=A0A1H7CN63_9RHOB|nr:Protein of unknown function [Cribrihabitans marinus]